MTTDEELAYIISMDNAAMDKMQAMIREQSERIVALSSYALARDQCVEVIREAIAHCSRHGERVPERWIETLHSLGANQGDAVHEENRS